MNDETLAVHLVPQPQSMRRLPGSYDLRASRTLRTDDRNSAAAAVMDAWLEGYGVRVRPADRDERGDITLQIDSELPDEAYELLVDAGITVCARDEAGVRYALQTLRQLLPTRAFAPSPGASLPLPCVAISDRPRFGWRGAMLDVGRRFLPAPYLLRYLDLMAAHKLNVLHLHLTEDAGWRMQIDRYPRLVEIGSRRPGTVVGRGNSDGPTDGVPHQGFYSKADLRRVVDHAARLGITVVPEIDVPGHTQAAIASYPELGNSTDAPAVATGWGVGRHVLNAEDHTVAFFEGVLEEVLDVFPGRYVHLGGDECVTEEWERSSSAQRRMAEAGLNHERELVAWFVTRLDRFLRDHGRRGIAWDELVESGAAPDLTIMSWRSNAHGIEALRRGHDVIMAPQENTYFDFYQSRDRAGEPLAFDNLLTLRQAYDWDPAPDGVADLPGRVLGAQYQIWSEYVDGPEAVEYMSFPRACAFAEVAWCGRRDYEAFLTRLDTHVRRLESARVNYRPLSGI